VNDLNTAPATPDIAKKLGLLPEEFYHITQILGRIPNFTELSVFSVMWSEHCSYKNSIRWLKQLPKKGKNVLAEAGEENAGMIGIGNDLAVCFKIESHNHPSAVEPYQGAATGVGGIHRDIFTMGARPIAALNSLRFGDLSSPKTQKLLRGVVKGIGDYGNSFGVPTVGGEVYFDPCYNTNPLVNAMSVGIVDVNKTVSAIAEGVGNPVFIVGSATGKDGIHGATFASQDISENSAEQLPAIQVGDPFFEKLLLEASLELIETGAVVGMQDMGAAGIACSSSETSAKGKVGMDLWLDQVPMRQANMQPFEILLSESQERMLVIVHQGRESEVLNVFHKWDLPCVQIGVVTDTLNIRYFWHGELVGDIPAESLVLGGGAPIYERDFAEPAYLEHVKHFNPFDVHEPELLLPVLLKLLSEPSIASKKWVTAQYDSTVGAAAMSHHVPMECAVVHIKGTEKSLALSVDCNSRYVQANPRKGCALAVAEAARNIVCGGGTPLGITNCLNFGNPYNPEVYWQFKESILGMKDACEAFGIPVTGGNVSFYNQSEEGPVFPTPTIGMVGLIENTLTQTMSNHFKNVGDLIYLLGNPVEDIGCSAYVYHYHHIKFSPAPYLDLEEEYRLQQFVLQLIEKQPIHSAKDVSDGGLLVALCESAFPNQLGFAVYNPLEKVRNDFFFFGEAGGRVIVSVHPDHKEHFEHLLSSKEFPFLLIGQVTAENIEIEGRESLSISEARTVYESALPKYLER